MLRYLFVLHIWLCYFSLGKAQLIDELKQQFVNVIIQCLADHPISADDLEMLKNKNMPNKESVNCLFACVYKAAGMMNEEGQLWIEGVNKMSEKYLSDDPVKMQKSLEFTEACRNVNDVTVNDGNKGCERAALILQCTMQKAPFFDIV